MTEALTQKDKYAAYVDRLAVQVIAALPISVRDEDLRRAKARMRVAFNADANGALLECTGESIARAIVLSAMSGLFPGGPKPDVYLIPRRNKHRGNALEVNWQLSFRGFIRLARRAGWDLEPVLVFEGEDFRVEEGMAPKVHHVRNLDVEQSWGTLRYAYVRILPPAGRAKLAYLNKSQIEQRRKKAQDQNIWNEWPLEMAMKTICNYAGNREAFPLDDPARYAMEASEMAEVGGGSPLQLGAAAPAALPARPEGAEIDLSARPSPNLAEGGGGEQGSEADRGSWAPTEPSGAVQVAEDLRPPKSQEEYVEEIRALLKERGVTGERREQALVSAFGVSWIKVVKLPAAQLAVGLEQLRTELSTAVAAEAMREREPGEEPEEEL